MKINEGPLDRIIRGIAGVALLALGLFGMVGGWLLWVVYLFGAILLVTGIVGFCPLYTLLKINTAKK